MLFELDDLKYEKLLNGRIKKDGEYWLDRTNIMLIGLKLFLDKNSNAMTTLEASKKLFENIGVSRDELKAIDNDDITRYMIFDKDINIQLAMAIEYAIRLAEKTKNEVTLDHNREVNLYEKVNDKLKKELDNIELKYQKSLTEQLNLKEELAIQRRKANKTIKSLEHEIKELKELLK